MKEISIEQQCHEYREAISFLNDLRTKQGIFHPADSIKQRIESVMLQYENHAADALRAAKEFRDRQLVDLRAMALVLQMVSQADTHKEKNSRLRGCLELINSSVDRLEREEFELHCGRKPYFDRLFQADFPTRHYVDRIHELERQLDAATKAASQPTEAA